jgi:hypothetical protein
METDKDTFYRITEYNDWEGETWYHYFLDKPGVKEALEEANKMLGDESDFTSIDRMEMSEVEQLVLANWAPEYYMEPHWFGELDIEKLKQASRKDLYKGGIRDYGEDLFEVAIWSRRRSVKLRSPHCKDSFLFHSFVTH